MEEAESNANGQNTPHSGTETAKNDQTTPLAGFGALPLSTPCPDQSKQPLSKNAQKKLLKLQRYEEKKAQTKAASRERKKQEGERKRREWEEKLNGVSEEEKARLLESRKELRRERMDMRAEEREKKRDKLRRAMETGQNIVVDLEFADLMKKSEINSLVQQIMYCYAVNKKCSIPAHLWLTGCKEEMGTQLQKIPGSENWIIERETRSYIEALHDRKENLVYLTADSENTLEELDPKEIYIIGGLVDRNRWKGITEKKAKEQGIKSAKLPIGSYIKMSSSQVLTVNQVVEILLSFLETKDWKKSFFQVIPQRKQYALEEQEDGEEDGLEAMRKCTEEQEEEEKEDKEEGFEAKRKCIEEDEGQNKQDGFVVKRKCTEKEELGG
ncbi:hypothetical protein AMTRI_Chr10g7360 [Amborella trichopoda]|uniref:tRNA (guanine(9)-N(1))-methyltransferase n=1 Tax=Amborella trichopoda TaxID=13333 RepID=U5DCV6_AMBTC|nr:tRNA (guanine(9)-N1)-methyltransferase [Amborella trichopoda]ERN19257.1 hypothetical protein AMTR_s00061p00213950 [Amborella trichopoda]|eukprot:XP_006857790.1 tRNA (guanine(9)-N1)-methyltransferase [Amborella trichopoda]